MVRDRLIEFVEHETSLQGLTEGRSFVSLGLDSLEFIDLIQQVEQEFGVKIPESEWKDLNTLGDLIAHVSERKS